MGREAILKSVKENKPSLIPLPEIKIESFEEKIDLLETFKEKVKLVGGTIQEVEASSTIDTSIKERYPNAKKIVDCSSVSSLETVSISNKTPQDIEDIDLAIVKGEFGIAENGAVWITDNDFEIRALPFITNDLVIVLEKNKIYNNMHQAYAKISKRKRSFGVFVSGPSKTADIEQCLVVGAQGAMSLSVFII